MWEWLANISVTTWIAVYAAIVSTITAFVRIKIARRDKGMLEITGFIGRIVPDKTGVDYLTLIITNIGRRPLVAEGIATKEKRFGKQRGIIFPNNLPKKLGEGDSVTEMYDHFDAIKNHPHSMYVYDSTGHKYYMKRRVLRSILRQYDQIVSKQKDEKKIQITEHIRQNR